MRERVKPSRRMLRAAAWSQGRKKRGRNGAGERLLTERRTFLAKKGEGVVFGAWPKRLHSSSFSARSSFIQDKTRLVG
jgi:hypothetical protein